MRAHGDLQLAVFLVHAHHIFATEKQQTIVT